MVFQIKNKLVWPGLADISYFIVARSVSVCSIEHLSVKLLGDSYKTVEFVIEYSRQTPDWTTGGTPGWRSRNP